MESIPEDHRTVLEVDVYGMSVAESMNWKGDTEGNKPVWTTPLIPSFHVCQLVNKYLLSPYRGPDNERGWTGIPQFHW